jgi:hypothetical protein
MTSGNEELEKCYLCPEEIAHGQSKYAFIDIHELGGPDTISMHKECFASAPWKKLEKESNVEMFVSVGHMVQGAHKLDDFPGRIIYKQGTGIVDIMNGAKPVPTSIVRANQ